MSPVYEYETIMEELWESGFGYSLITNLCSSVLGIAAYVLTGLALYTLANRRGLKNPWLSWIPVVNCWIVGSLSDQYRYVVKGEVKNKRKILLTLNIVNAVISIAFIVCFCVGIVLAIMGTSNYVPEEDILAPLLIGLVLLIPFLGVSIATAVVRYMAMYDIYTSCTPKNNTIFLVLSILFSVTESFFLFFTRNKDDGMPPRKPEPAPYVPTQEPWNNPDIQ